MSACDAFERAVMGRRVAFIRTYGEEPELLWLTPAELFDFIGTLPFTQVNELMAVIGKETLAGPIDARLQANPRYFCGLQLRCEP